MYKEAVSIKLWRMKFTEVVRERQSEKVTTEQNSKIVETRYMQIARQRDLQNRD